MLQAINFREKIPPKRRQENRPLVSRTDSHIYYSLDQSLRFYYERYVVFLAASLLPMVVLFLILKER